MTPVVTGAPLRAGVSLQSMLYEPFVMVVPFASGLATRTTICTVPEAAASNAPRLQVTALPERAPPDAADTKIGLAGSVSAITPPVPFPLPPSRQVIVTVIIDPATPGTG